MLKSWGENHCNGFMVGKVDAGCWPLTNKPKIRERFSLKLLDEISPWLRHTRISDFGIAVGESGRFGLGAVLIIERVDLRQLLFVRKAYRSGFEGSDQLAFPGGMIKPDHVGSNVQGWILPSLTTRAGAEVGLDPQNSPQILPFDVAPPVVAAYTVREQRRHTVILPFTLVLRQPFHPAAHDSSVYDPAWRDATEFWSEITPTNRLITGYYLWSRLSNEQRRVARRSLEEALREAMVWAREVDLPEPPAPWDL